MNSVYDKYDHKKSSDNAREWLLEYEDWCDEAAKKKITVGGIAYDGMPKAHSYDPDKRIVEYTNATNQCRRRELVLEYIKSKGDIHETYSSILEYRFVKHHWSVTHVRMKLHLAERTFTRMQNDALWEAARIIPEDGILVKKQSGR
ncbi:MAG TPA: transcriptional regulator [Limosilactobacillus oris]|uniref:transcriptional regulator n=1 Tax=Limosilactobacillus oris TaxID=1632 RepID=UPI001D42F26C|nr:transcriptional regulator [Limosilactobacillus oris]HJF47475.1 transcriptional regulator [Limosilactobacillus oris]